MMYVETVDKTQLYVKDWGTGSPVILIHGWPLTADSWDDLAIPFVNAGHRVIAYDRRGFGRSSQPWSGYDYDTLANDLAAVIAATDAKDAALVGFSMGGGEVARYMSRHSGRNVSRVALVSSVVPYLLQTPDNPDGVPQAIFDQMAEAMKADRPKFFTGFFKDFFGVSWVKHPVSDEILHWAWLMTMQASLRATLACAEAFATTDFRPDLPYFTVPTLIIHGTADRTVPIDPSGRAAAKGIAGAKLIEYEGSPHGLFATDQERLTNDLLDFLKG